MAAADSKIKLDKDAAGDLEKKLFYTPKSSWSGYENEQSKKIFDFAESYKKFLALAKTERLCIRALSDRLTAEGFRAVSVQSKLKKNSKFFSIIRGKCLIAGIAGNNPSAFQIIGSHGDSPRLDLKPVPLYEDSELVLCKSHYYGGIKKYHWVNTPLALHGIVCTDKGQTEVHIGENDDECKFIIPDLLPHLSQEQMKKEPGKIIEGEELNVITGHIPHPNKELKEKIKTAVLSALNKKYGITEKDFITAELSFVPAGKPCDIGLDRGLTGGYGQDDRVCAFASVEALCGLKETAHTALVLITDKEEVGSPGNTGAESTLLPDFVHEYAPRAGVVPEQILKNSRAISADVTAAVDPTFKSVHELKNASFLGRGVSIEKYGGSRGKYSSNDAHAEYMYYMRKLADTHRIPWQAGELGKVDLGGGGTIAMYLSRFGMDCVDAGPCMLGMHSPCEITSKADVYAAYELYKAFLAD